MEHVRGCKTGRAVTGEGEVPALALGGHGRGRRPGLGPRGRGRRPEAQVAQLTHQAHACPLRSSGHHRAASPCHLARLWPPGTPQPPAPAPSSPREPPDTPHFALGAPAWLCPCPGCCLAWPAEPLCLAIRATSLKRPTLSSQAVTPPLPGSAWCLLPPNLFLVYSAPLPPLLGPGLSVRTAPQPLPTAGRMGLRDKRVVWEGSRARSCRTGLRAGRGSEAEKSARPGRGS